MKSSINLHSLSKTGCAGNCCLFMTDVHACIPQTPVKVMGSKTLTIEYLMGLDLHNMGQNFGDPCLLIHCVFLAIIQPLSNFFLAFRRLTSSTNIFLVLFETASSPPIKSKLYKLKRYTKKGISNLRGLLEPARRKWSAAGMQTTSTKRLRATLKQDLKIA